MAWLGGRPYTIRKAAEPRHLAVSSGPGSDRGTRFKTRCKTRWSSVTRRSRRSRRGDASWRTETRLREHTPGEQPAKPVAGTGGLNRGGRPGPRCDGLSTSRGRGWGAVPVYRLAPREPGRGLAVMIVPAAAGIVWICTSRYHQVVAARSGLGWADRAGGEAGGERSHGGAMGR